MKNFMKLFFAGALMSALCVVFAACNEPKGQEQNEEGTEIQPIPVNEVSPEIIAYFDDYEKLSVLGKTIGIGRDFGTYSDQFLSEDDPIGGCLMINSTDELPDVDYNGTPLNYPIIDFNSHTLIIGLYADKGGECVVSQSLTVEEGVAIINITIGKRNNGELYPLVTQLASFWGIYPKINAEAINTNVIRE